MSFPRLLLDFLNDDAGAVTVDWVVLTSAVVGMGIAMMDIVGDGIEDLGTRIVNDLNARNSGFVSAPATP